MSYCVKCGTQKTTGICTSCNNGSHIHGSNNPYSSHHSDVQQPHFHHQPTVVYHGINPQACKTTSQTPCTDDYKTTDGGLRPILSGYFKAEDANGRSVPFARVTVSYAGGTSLVALFDDAGNLIPNPATTDVNGLMPLYYRGGNIDIVVERTNENGEPCEVVQSLRNQGGYVDSDFYLQDDDILGCVDLEQPLIRLYDQNNCNLPAGLINPKQLALYQNWKAGVPVGVYSEVKKLFECLGIDFPCGITVFGDSNGTRYKYDCENCTVAIPPDPETVDFNSDGTSDCWTKLDEFSACIYDEVDLNENQRVLVCNEGSNALAPIYKAGDNITIDNSTGEISSSGGLEILDTPVTVLSFTRTRTAGDYDSTNVTLDLDTLSGVTVPPGAKGVILQTAVGINGYQESPGTSGGGVGGAFVHIEAAKTAGLLNGGDLTNSGQVPTLVGYVDTNLGANDNDSTSYPIIPLNDTSIAYRAKARWDGTFTGTDNAFITIRVVGFL